MCKQSIMGVFSRRRLRSARRSSSSRAICWDSRSSFQVGTAAVIVAAVHREMLLWHSLKAWLVGMTVVSFFEAQSLQTRECCGSRFLNTVSQLNQVFLRVSHVCILSHPEAASCKHSQPAPSWTCWNLRDLPCQLQRIIARWFRQSERRNVNVKESRPKISKISRVVPSLKEERWQTFWKMLLWWNRTSAIWLSNVSIQPEERERERERLEQEKEKEREREQAKFTAKCSFTLLLHMSQGSKHPTKKNRSAFLLFCTVCLML